MTSTLQAALDNGARLLQAGKAADAQELADMLVQQFPETASVRLFAADAASLTGDVSAAIQRTLMGAGRAMVLTSLVIVLGLAVLHGSDFVPTRRFAEITSVTMVAALFGDLLLLPACLRLFAARPRTAP